MFESINKRTLGLGGAALAFAAAFAGLLWAFEPSALWDWVMTLAATSISVVFAVALFWYQSEKGDQDRQEQILLSLAAEARACLDMLAERPAELRAPNGEVLETAVLVPLPAKVLDEAIRSGLHDPSDTFGLVLAAGHVHAHNADVAALTSMEGDRVGPEVLRGAVKRLKWRQGIVADYCRHLVENIEALGIPEPRLRNARKPEA